MIGALDLGCVFNDAFEFLATDAPLFLTPVASGDPVKFMHGLRSGDVDTTDQDPLVAHEFIAWTMEPLCMGGTYEYNGETWTATRSNYHKAGGPVAPTDPNMPHNYLMIRFKR